ncbi:MAG: GntR family transcriptional regulator [Lachnospiraceae bacterium]
MDKNSPKYIAVYNQIRSEIFASKYEAGSFLPPEGELIDKYGVSRTTIRRAVNMLKVEGLVDVQQGRGTEVLPVTMFDTSYNFFSIKSSASVTSRFTIEGKYNTSSQGAIIDIIPAELKIAKALNVPPGTDVYRLQRVKLINDEVFCYVTSYVLTTLAPDLEQYSGQIYFLYKFLVDHYNISYEYGQDIISADIAGFVESRLLNIKMGAPLLIFKRITYSNNIPFEYSESINRGDLLEIVVNSQASSPYSYY